LCLYKARSKRQKPGETLRTWQLFHCEIALNERQDFQKEHKNCKPIARDPLNRHKNPADKVLFNTSMRAFLEKEAMAIRSLYSGYRSGKDNVAPDSFTRAFSTSMSSNNLEEILIGLCHPGVTRMLHLVKSKNLPYSTEEVKKVCSAWRSCAELKPQFYRPQQPGNLIDATQPMERLSIDFKGPLLTATRNAYILTVVDEYSRFPFAFLCPNMQFSTVIMCLNQLFSLCGKPNYIHSDLVERYNDIIWKAVRLALRSANLPDSRWELVLADALHSTRSLLCTSTNATPHEIFFNFHRRSSYGVSLPSWMQPGPVLLRRFVRTSKNDPLVDEVELTDVNPTCARNGTPLEPQPSQEPLPASDGFPPAPNSTTLQVPEIPSAADNAEHELLTKETGLRRSTRVSKPPARYGW
ncbi:retrovirus-related Pol poly from transposon, partial [Paramuricea clavata]